MKTLIISGAFFLVIYGGAYHVIFRRRPSPSERAESSSCVISLFHGTPGGIAAAATLSSASLSSLLSLSAANSDAHNAIMEYSIAYFATDILHYLLFFPEDTLFIAHHVATIFVLSTCRYYSGRGAGVVLSVLVIAEATSFCQNVWTLARARRRESAAARKVYNLISMPFYGIYSVARGLVAPFFIYKVGEAYVKEMAVVPEDQRVSGWLLGGWAATVAGGIAGSLIWVGNLWSQWIRERKEKKMKELKSETEFIDSTSSEEKKKKSG